MNVSIELDSQSVTIPANISFTFNENKDSKRIVLENHYEKFGASQELKHLYEELSTHSVTVIKFKFGELREYQCNLSENFILNYSIVRDDEEKERLEIFINES